MPSPAQLTRPQASSSSLGPCAVALEAHVALPGQKKVQVGAMLARQSGGACRGEPVLDGVAKATASPFRRSSSPVPYLGGDWDPEESDVDRSSSSTSARGMLTQETVDMLKDAISDHVDVPSFGQRSNWRGGQQQLPATAPGSAPGCKGGAHSSSLFGVSRLGIPSGTTTDASSSSAPSATGGAAASSGRSADRPRSLEKPPSSRGVKKDKVRYIQIPKHAVKDFRDFARGVAAQACRDSATYNPYVQALNKHRAELQYPINFDGVVGESSTVCQQLGTQREALSTLSAVGAAGVHVPIFSIGCNADEVDRGIFGSGVSVQCCSNREGVFQAPYGDPTLLDQYGHEFVVRPHATLVAGDWSTTGGRSPLSTRSNLSTTCSRQSVCEEADHQNEGSQPAPAVLAAGESGLVFEDGGQGSLLVV